MNQRHLDDIVESCRPLIKEGRTAAYIPALQEADPGHLGVCVASKEGTVSSGDANIRFTIQSIVKTLIFTCSLMDSGMERVFQSVSVEPTSDSFDSITSLETKNFNKPLNPMINAGAIVSLTFISGNAAERVLSLARRITHNDRIDINEKVYLSEKATGARNRALAYYMKSTGVIDGNVEELLDAYFRVCSIEVDCFDLASIGLFYANNGIDTVSGEVVVPAEIARIVKAAMTMCGMYDESGRVAVTVGLPTKSGVGGGILSAAPNRLGIGIYGPALNQKGSSIAGLAILEELSRQYNLSIF